MRVQVDDEGVGLDDDVAAGDLTDDGRGLAIEEAGADVQCLVVVGDPHQRRLAGRVAFDRIPLQEVARGLGDRPDRIVQAAVDDGRIDGPAGLQLARRDGLRRGGGDGGSGHPEQEQAEGNDARSHGADSNGRGSIAPSCGMT